MPIWGFVLTFLIASCGGLNSAFAAEILLTHPSDLTRADRPTGLAQAEKATIQIAVRGNGMGVATAVAISNQGYFLTARHNIEFGIRAFKVEPYKNSKIKINVFDQKLNGNYIYATRDFNSWQVEKANLVAVGPATTVLDTTAMLKDQATVEELRLKGWSELSDFAIIRFADTKKYECVRTAQKPVVGNDAIWSLQIPGATQRLSHNADGSSIYFSAGHVLNDLQESSCFRDVFPKADAEVWRAINWVSVGSGVRFSTLDASTGSSGAPVFDADGNLAGIIISLFSGTKNPKEEFCPATQFIPIAKIKALVRENYGAKVEADVFDCQE